MIIGSGSLTSKMDKICMDGFKIPSLILMENAASSAVKRIEKIMAIEDKDAKKTFTIISGHGNNGGDGLAIARKLNILGHKVRVVFIGHESNMTESTRINMEILKSIKLEISYFDPQNYHLHDTEMVANIKKADYIIDTLFGVGLNRELNACYKGFIGTLNRSKNIYGFKIISIDTPSGINPSSGRVMGDAVEADYTITFEYFKKGFLNYSIEEYLGEVFVESIGIPKEVYNYIDTDKEDISGCFIDEKYIKSILRKRKPSSNKSDYGSVLVYAGSRGYYGAAYISTRAATKSGSGLVTLVSDEETIGVNATRLVEEMTCLESDSMRLDKLILRSKAIVFGPGKADKENAKKQLYKLLSDIERLTKKENIGSSKNSEKDNKQGNSNIEPKLIIDAGGLDVFDPKAMVKGREVVMTPHSGEFARMIESTSDYVDQNRLDLAKKYAGENNIVLVLKGKNTIITDGDKLYVNTTGNSSMANGGMGDALTGMIASFCGQGYSVLEAAVLGVYIHGLIGDEIFKNKYIVNAGDLIKMIPKIVKILYNI